MRAARIHAFGADPVVEEVPTPKRNPGQSLVRIEAAALSHLDMTVTSGQFELRPELPHVGGTDGTGVVVASDTFEAGTRVLVRGAGIGLVKNGCWAEYLVASDRALSVVDSELEPPVAASYFLPTTTGYVAVHDVGELAAGERVIVTGAAGAVGSMAAQFAVLAGASEVISVVPRPEQAELVPPKTRPVVGTGADVVTELGEDPVATLLVDTVGGEGLADLLRLVQPGGRAALVGYTLGTKLSLDLPSWLLRDVRLLPVNMIRKDQRARELGPEMAHLLAAGTLNLRVQPFAFDDIAPALRKLREGTVNGRAVVLPCG
ncbi:quinone oxidoreductase family protein [Amycolatopsis cihanbeyliensis]|uniref:NADPH:quinone reductase-like Zn-dependent oxidoreductase n=1 Tax=Amycolatopsis cihanbeyliensis TaxID=1128664 RepID=A0A542DRH4_AMYCI|nr:zinc-binding dehydrogenase [Amycolatopsis cihanbeyliensis]TQJ05584.1 NADPH:quinone reductase-like Zn-dependent oxidoreductase [Amycolatopsis cihanbeyliensis]